MLLEPSMKQEQKLLAFLPPDPVAAGSGHEYVRTERLY